MLHLQLLDLALALVMDFYSTKLENAQRFGKKAELG